MTPFYLTDIENETATLTGEEARHCVKVLRLKRGDDVIGVDGKGRMYACQIKDLAKNLVELRIINSQENWGEHTYRICLWVSPLHKADRFEWLVEKAVEMGATEIRPYISKRTVKVGLRLDRLQRIAIAGLKQCLRSRLPEIHEPVPFQEALDSMENQTGMIAWMDAKTPVLAHSSAIEAAQSLDLWLGPEGGFTDEEAQAVIDSGLWPVSLGANRLRTETAGIHLLSLVKGIKGY